MQPFTAHASPSGISHTDLGRRIAVVTLTGPLSIGTVADLEVELGRRIADGRDEIVLDITGASAVSPTAGFVLGQLASELYDDCTVIVAVRSGPGRQALEDACVPERWSLLPTVEASLSELLRRPVQPEPRFPPTAAG